MGKGLHANLRQSLGIIKTKGESHELVNLMKVPPKEKTKPRVLNFKKNAVQQADLLDMQDDDGYLYALVVVDTATKLADFRPMKTKDTETVIKEIESIWRGSYLDKPKQLATDRGGEFGKRFSEFLESKNVKHKLGRTNRHRQQGVVEAMNKLIGKFTGELQNLKEMETGEASTQWVDAAKKIIVEYNASIEKNAKPASERMKNLPTLRCRGRSCILLDKGTKVRVISDMPRNIVTGDRLHGTFRATDIRWDPQERTVTKIILKAGQPPMYKVSGINDALYTREQLQEVDAKEKKIDQSKRKWVVEKIVRKYKEGRKYFYEIKWRHYPKTTPEPAEVIEEDVPELVAEFKEKHPDKVEE